MDEQSEREPGRELTNEEQHLLDTMRDWDSFEKHSSTEIVDAYVGTMRHLDEDPDSEATSAGPLWREEAVNFEERVRVEIKEDPLRGADLFMHALHVEDHNARLLVAHCVDVLVARAPHLTLDVLHRLLSDEAEIVRARAAVVFLDCAESFANRDVEAELRPVLRLVAESYPEDAAGTWTSLRGSAHPRRTDS